jgi:hypothetical protein
MTRQWAPRMVGEEERAQGCGFGPHWRAGGNGNGRRREGARGCGGDRCGVTKGAKMREGGEQRVQCGEAAAGAHFIWPGILWGGGEAAGSGGVLILIGFEGVNGEEETRWCRFSEGVKAARRRFGSALRARRRLAVGGARRGGAGHGQWRLCRTKEGDDPLGGPSWAGVATLTGLQLGQSGPNGPTRGVNKATVQAKIVNGRQKFF